MLTGLAGQSKTKNGGHQSGHQPLQQQGHHSRNSGVITAKATVEHGQNSRADSSLCNKSTGAIPKQKSGGGTTTSSSLDKFGQDHSSSAGTVSQVNVNKQQPSVINKPSTNHLDEIVTLPLDDTTTHVPPRTQRGAPADPLNALAPTNKRNGSSGVKDLPLSK